MNRKYLNAILFGALLVGATGTFVSCSDYDDDIDGLSARVDAVEKSISDLKQQIENGAVVTAVEQTSNGITTVLSPHIPPSCLPMKYLKDPVLWYRCPPLPHTGCCR